MSAGETKAVETTGPTPMILCVSRDGHYQTSATHALRRLELDWKVEGDGATTGCGVDLDRPLSVFFAPIDEVTCQECVARVLGTRRK